MKVNFQNNTNECGICHAYVATEESKALFSRSFDYLPDNLQKEGDPVKSANQIDLDVLAVLVGEQKYDELATVFAGRSLHFPRINYRKRNREIRQAYFNGVPREALASQYGLSLSSIDHIIAEKP